MFNQLYGKMTQVWIAYEDLKRDPVAMIKRLERGDADSSGSTMRTAGIVALILAIFLLLGGAVYTLANATTGQIKAPAFK
jgi:hypothetical protein